MHSIATERAIISCCIYSSPAMLQSQLLYQPSYATEPALTCCIFSVDAWHCYRVCYYIRQLSQRDEAAIDVTEHDPFKWWLFLANLGPNTQNAFGTGITSVQIHKRENKIGIRTTHADSAVQWVILTPHRASFKTQLAASFSLCYRASYYISPAMLQSQLCTSRLCQPALDRRVLWCCA